MLKLWGRNSSSNVEKITWACEEMGLDYDHAEVGGKFGGLNEDSYRAMNPNMLVPAIEDDGFMLWESNAILRYLAETYGQDTLWIGDTKTRAVADQWMDWCQTVVRPTMLPIVFGLIVPPPEQRNPEMMEMELRTAEIVWGIFNDFLEGRDFVAGERFTMGDIPPAVMAYRWFWADINHPKLEPLEAWFARMRERPGFRHNVLEVDIV